MTRPSWNQYFINIAKEVAKKSKDPSTQVGCVIVTADNRPVSFGYNGFVAGCDEQFMTFERPMKYFLVIHAEMNALIFAKQSLKECKAYITHGPCENCLKHLMQAGIAKIIYDNPGVIKKRGTDEQKEAVKKLLNSSPVICKNINGTDYVNDF
ncbi:MAG: deaminase [Candidatus Jacksonbacteria bacterium]